MAVQPAPFRGRNARAAPSGVPTTIAWKIVRLEKIESALPVFGRVKRKKILIRDYLLVKGQKGK